MIICFGYISMSRVFLIILGLMLGFSVNATSEPITHDCPCYNDFLSAIHSKGASTDGALLIYGEHNSAKGILKVGKMAEDKVTCALSTNSQGTEGIILSVSEGPVDARLPRYLNTSQSCNVLTSCHRERKNGIFRCRDSNNDISNIIPATTRKNACSQAIIGLCGRNATTFGMPLIEPSVAYKPSPTSQEELDCPCLRMFDKLANDYDTKGAKLTPKGECLIMKNEVGKTSGTTATGASFYKLLVKEQSCTVREHLKTDVGNWSFDIWFKVFDRNRTQSSRACKATLKRICS